MDSQTIAKYTGLPVGTIEHYLHCSAEEIYNDHEYHVLLRSLDRKTLDATLPDVRELYDLYMDEFGNFLKETYHIDRGVMSGYTLGNWLLGFLQQPDHIADILKFHGPMPGEAFEGGLERLLVILESLPEGKREWQQALCLMAFPMIVK